MRILGLDLETTGLNPGEHRITELAFVLKEVGISRPLTLDSLLIYEDGAPAPSPEITALTGITDGMMKEFGVTFQSACTRLEAVLSLGVDCIVAHNGENFDKPFLFKKMKDQGIHTSAVFDIPWVDSAADVEYPFATRKLKYLAAEYGIQTPYSHMALFDVLTMLDVFERQDIAKAIARSKSPWITIRAMVDFEDREKAKKARFMWEAAGDKYFSKCWVKRIKECDYEKETKQDFKVVRLD